MRFLKKRKPDLEQFFHVPGAAFVDQEQDHVVVRFDDHVIVGNQYLFPAHDGADGSAFRQVDILDGTAHHFRGFAVAVGDGLDGFRCAPAQDVESVERADNYGE